MKSAFVYRIRTDSRERERERKSPMCRTEPARHRSPFPASPDTNRVTAISAPAVVSA